MLAVAVGVTVAGVLQWLDVAVAVAVGVALAAAVAVAVAVAVALVAAGGSWSGVPAGPVVQRIKLTWAVAEDTRVKQVSSSLHSRGGAVCPPLTVAIDYVEATICPSYNLSSKLALPLPAEILRPPLDVEDTIRCRATYRGEYAEPTIRPSIGRPSMGRSCSCDCSMAGTD